METRTKWWLSPQRAASSCGVFRMEEVEVMIKEITGAVEYLRGISPVWEELEKGERDHVI